MSTRIIIFTSIALLACTSIANAGPCALEIQALTKSLAAKDAGSGPIMGSTATGAQTSATQSGQHPPTAVMGQETQGKATSAEDVRRQNQGEGTAAQQGGTGTGASDRMVQASNALQRARALDNQGKEAECMDSVRHAKELLGR